MALDTMEAARRLINAATGDPSGDGLIVTDIGVGYASHRYGMTDETVWVKGNWNDTGTAWEDQREGRKPKNADTVPSRLFDALERIGVEAEWLDEYDRCIECERLIRTQPDSYSWQPEYMWIDDHGHLCAECALDDLEGTLEAGDYLNNSDKVVTFCDAADVEAIGFEQWTGVPPGSERGDFASGWFEGQNDSPSDILEKITTALPDSEVVFFLDETSQFYIRFSAYVRTTEVEEGE